MMVRKPDGAETDGQMALAQPLIVGVQGSHEMTASHVTSVWIFQDLLQVSNVGASETPQKPALPSHCRPLGLR